MNQNTPEQDPRSSICRILAKMLPSTADEIAQSAGLEPETVAHCLDELRLSCRVMFNPLTKRYSLPKTRAGSGLAA